MTSIADETVFNNVSILSSDPDKIEKYKEDYEQFLYSNFVAIRRLQY